jgi:hypothetical protein
MTKNLTLTVSPNTIDLIEALDAAVQLSYKTDCLVRFELGHKQYRCWYVSVSCEGTSRGEQSHYAEVQDDKNEWVPIPRDKGRWGWLVLDLDKLVHDFKP